MTAFVICVGSSLLSKTVDVTLRGTIGHIQSHWPKSMFTDVFRWHYLSKANRKIQIKSWKFVDSQRQSNNLG